MLSSPPSSATIRSKPKAMPAGGDGGRVRDREDGVPLAGAEDLGRTGALVGPEELRHRRAPVAARLDRGPDETLGAEGLRLLSQLVEPAAGEVARRAQPADHATRLERAREDLE